MRLAATQINWFATIFSPFNFKYALSCTVSNVTCIDTADLQPSRVDSVIKPFDRDRSEREKKRRHFNWYFMLRMDVQLS